MFSNRVSRTTIALCCAGLALVAENANANDEQREAGKACVAGGAHPTITGTALLQAKTHIVKTGKASDSAVKSTISWKAVGAEFVAMTLFVIIGCGSAMGIAKEPGSAWVLQVSLSFGLAITALAYSVGHYSGAHINCAVTFGLVLAQQVSVVQGLVIFVAQMLGSVLGALILLQLHHPEEDKTGSIGCNGVSEGCTQRTALVGEVAMTFLLMFVVLETAVDNATTGNRMLAPLAIGLAVFLAHSVLIPIDGCSINPTRSFGPAVVGSFVRSPAVKDAWKDMWVFWVGPLAGAGLAVGVHTLLAL